MTSISMPNNMSSLSDKGLTSVTGELNKQASPAVEVKDDIGLVAKAIQSATFKPSNVAEASKPTQEVIAKAAAQLQDFVQSMGRNLTFSIDKTTGYHVVTVVNPDTGELIRQLPSKELLEIAQRMAQLNNALISQKA